MAGYHMLGFNIECKLKAFSVTELWEKLGVSCFDFD